MTKINPHLHTSCKGCIFAVYQDITQIGCLIGELDKFRKFDRDILEAYDEEKEFFILNNTQCFKKREKLWADNKTTKDIGELVKIIDEEIAIRCHIIILATNNLQHLKTTLDSLSTQVLLPSYVTIIRHTSNTIKPTDILPLTQKLKFKWRIENLTQPMSDESAVDMVIPFVKSNAYMIIQAGSSIPKNTLTDINISLHDKFMKFVGLEHNGKLIYVARQLHIDYQGNYEKPLLDKLIDDKCQDFILPIQEVVKNYG